MLSPAPSTNEAARAEGGFTLIELLIAMVLAAVVFGIVGVAASSLLVGSAQSNASRNASATMTEVLRRFEQDVKYAQSPDVTERPRVGDDLRAMLLWGQARTATGAFVTTLPQACDTDATIATRDACTYEDVTVATSTELWIRSDVLNASSADDGVECVRWEIRSGALWRTVHHARADPDCRRIGSTRYVGSVASDEMLVEAPPNTGLGNGEGRAASFGYLIVANRPAIAAPPGSPVDPGDCVSVDGGYNAAPAARDRSFISAVSIDLAAVTTAAHGTAARNRSTASASLLGRANDEFVRAIGCAY